MIGLSLALAALLMVVSYAPQRLTLAQGAPSLRVASPAANASVQSPVTVRVEAQNANLKAADLGDRQSQHLHYFVDIDPATVLQAGQPIPTGRENIVHTADVSQTLNLQPGQHTVWVVMSNVDHVPLSPGVQAQVTFTVAAAGSGSTPASGQATPAAQQQMPSGGLTRTGTGGYLLDAPGSLAGALVLAGAIVLPALALLRRRSRRSA
jgi:hypothetical protein